MKEVEFKDLEGKVIKKIEGLEKESTSVKIHMECGKIYEFQHDQDCCECVDLDDFDIDFDLSGGLVLSCEESTNSDEGEIPEYAESWTWTFYRIETSKGGLFMKWLGGSNGYYSESVDIYEISGK